MSEVLSTQTEQQGAVSKLLKFLPLLQFFGGIIVAGCVAALASYSTIRVNQDSTARTVEKLKSDQELSNSRITEVKNSTEKQIDDLKIQILTKKEFEAKWEQIDLMRQDIKAIRQSQERAADK